MGKHNGKARTSGAKVGSTLVAKAKKEGKGTKAAFAGVGRHTTDTSKYGMQSVLETNDLNEIMNMADLAGRDFAAERGQAVVVSTGAAISDRDLERNAEERAIAQERNRYRLRIPRRPAWSRDTTAEQLDGRERESFLAWRRDLAKLEEDERLVLTPFEKNLEVWRQLWRVLERSHIIVQVIDARDPLTYRSTDLEDYARDIDPHKSSMLLLNKSDLLPEAARIAWADYFDSQGISYIFWSAKLAALTAEDDEALRAEQQCADHRVRLLGCEQLLAAFQAKAAAAAAASGHLVPTGDQAEYSEADGGSRQPRRLVVGLTGYPNVGKSSTINALFGSKKTAVAATPGKTKHFQTLIISDQLLLCDCPGLVLPKYAHSKAEMVAAGVIPIDRLTEVGAPIEVVLRQAGIQQIQRVYNISVPKSERRMPTASQMLSTFALARGWTTGAGLPDETRAGRQVLKDFCDGKLVSFCLPATAAEVPGISAPLPGASGKRVPAADAPADAQAPSPAESAADQSASGTGRGANAAATTPQPNASLRDAEEAAEAAAEPVAAVGDAAAAASRGEDDDSDAGADPAPGRIPGGAPGPAAGMSSLSAAQAAALADSDEEISEADLALMQELNLQPGGKQKPQRAAHKFHGKGKGGRRIAMMEAQAS